MNELHLKTAIEALRKVPSDHFNLNTHFRTPHGMKPTAENIINHTCGSSACALGWMALDPACRRLGFLPEAVATDGELYGVTFGYHTSDSAASEFFDIEVDTAMGLFGYESGLTQKIYGREPGYVELDQVIEKLEELLETGKITVLREFT